MRGKSIAIALSTIALVGASGAAMAKDKLTPEQRLEKRLEGRVAGEPVDCIYLPMVRDTTIYDRTAIVYDAGDTLYVNRPDSGVSSLDDDDVMVTQPTGSQLCSVDVVKLHDRTSHFFSGSVGLGKFVPYRKVEKSGN